MGDVSSCDVCRYYVHTSQPLMHCWDCAQLLCRACFTHTHRRHIADWSGTLVASAHVHHVVCLALDHLCCSRDQKANAWFVHLPLIMLQNACKSVVLLDDAWACVTDHVHT
jgi:hypothetical protein